MSAADRNPQKIIVGVDGSDSSINALKWAFGQAELTGATVEAIHTWHVDAAYGAAALMVPTNEFALGAKKTLEEAVSKASGGTPPVPIEERVFEAPAAKTLIEESKHASLLVVGSRGHGGFVGALIGSVSQYCVNHATCPVVVVRSAG
ncbi:universal stress protein [Glycomyces buryatensis]|uniref:Universal stress protein n=1 Tax=Glycomyces buryatensis TaxID=2570927 RepID=A0A4S8QEN1_9ACTN|nr:universal stress protein [Glycomyces buryatensis]THV42800.1 universal stress protein [Glycomyces buryatensis]